MDIERLKELADCDVFIGGNPIVVDRAKETLRTLISEALKTETTGCDVGGKVMNIDDLKELKKWVSDVNALDDTRLIVCISLYDDVQYLLRVFECFIDEAIADSQQIRKGYEQW